GAALGPEAGAEPHLSRSGRPAALPREQGAGPMSDTELETLRAAWAARAPTSPGPECPAPDAIWEAVAGDRPEAEVRAMIEHSLQCADCSALWRLARELHGAAGTLRPTPQGDVVPFRSRSTRWIAVAGLA